MMIVDGRKEAKETLQQLQNYRNGTTKLQGAYRTKTNNKKPVKMKKKANE